MGEAEGSYVRSQEKIGTVEEDGVNDSVSEWL